MIPAPDSPWPVGFRRRKSPESWFGQFVWVVIGLVGFLAFTSKGFQAAGIIMAFAGLFSLVWIEFEARCENRTVVRAVFGGMMAGMALVALFLNSRNRRQE